MLRRETLRGARGRQAPLAGSRRAGVTMARVIPLVLGLAVLALPRGVHAQQTECKKLQDPLTFAGLKIGGCLQGGIATDAVGVSTKRAMPPMDEPAEPGEFEKADKMLTVQIPATATIKKAFLVLYAKHAGGFNVATGVDPATQVKLGGKLLTFAGPPVDQNAEVPVPPDPVFPNAPTKVEVGQGYRVYDVTNGFGINGAGQYSYHEIGAADRRKNTSYDSGMAGAQLVVVFADPQHRQVRHVTFQPQFLIYSSTAVKFDVTNLPTCGLAPIDAVISFGVSFECSDENEGKLQIKRGSADTAFRTLTSTLGGRDDGVPPPSGFNCSQQDWNSMYSSGSFGYTNAGTLVGVAGDQPDSEPPSASDELFSTGMLDLSGKLEIQYIGDKDEFLTGAVVAIDLNDADCDMIADAEDNCPITPNTTQTDTDGDRFGDACDNSTACGNKQRENNEGCDDGNTMNGDGCDDDCFIERDYPCNPSGNDSTGKTGDASCASGDCDTSGGAPGMCTAVIGCGNGMLEAKEGCDDGNVMPSDKCNAMCLIEDDHPCNANAPGATGNASCASGICNTTGGGAGVCNPANTCGNGVLEAGEGCDDGASVAADGCNASCLIEEGGECNTDEDGNIGADSCAGGICGPDGRCSAGVGISGGGCNTGSGGGNAALLFFLGLWMASVLLRRGPVRAGGR